MRGVKIVSDCNALHVCFKDNGREGVKVVDGVCVCNTLIPICFDHVLLQRIDMGLSENRLSLNPLVNRQFAD